mgnify:CR=1 FL=1
MPRASADERRPRRRSRRRALVDAGRVASSAMVLRLRSGCYMISFPVRDVVASAFRGALERIREVVPHDLADAMVLTRRLLRFVFVFMAVHLFDSIGTSVLVVRVTVVLVVPTALRTVLFGVVRGAFSPKSLVHGRLVRDSSGEDFILCARP